MKRIRKTYNGTVPNNKILNNISSSQNDTYSCNYINNMGTYSENERVIGKWLNGKPIYQKIISDNVPTAAVPYDYAALNVTSLNIDQVIRINGLVTTSSTQLNIPFVFENSNGQQLIGLYYSNNYIHYSTNVSTYAGLPLIVILEYTKTTD